MYFSNALFHNSFSAKNHTRKHSFLIVWGLGIFWRDIGAKTVPFEKFFSRTLHSTYAFEQLKWLELLVLFFVFAVSLLVFLFVLNNCPILDSLIIVSKVILFSSFSMTKELVGCCLGRIELRLWQTLQELFYWQSLLSHWKYSEQNKLSKTTGIEEALCKGASRMISWLVQGEWLHGLGLQFRVLCLACHSWEDILLMQSAWQNFVIFFFNFVSCIRSVMHLQHMKAVFFTSAIMIVSLWPISRGKQQKNWWCIGLYNPMLSRVIKQEVDKG